MFHSGFHFCPAAHGSEVYAAQWFYIATAEKSCGGWDDEV